MNLGHSQVAMTPLFGIEMHMFYICSSAATVASELSVSVQQDLRACCLALIS